MPEMDGGELAARLKENAITKDIPVMFLTGLVTPDSDSGSSKENIYISKSAKLGELFAAIEKLI